jgi:hypothetical protein
MRYGFVVPEAVSLGSNQSQLGECKPGGNNSGSMRWTKVDLKKQSVKFLRLSSRWRSSLGSASDKTAYNLELPHCAASQDGRYLANDKLFQTGSQAPRKRCGTETAECNSSNSA